MLRPARIVTFAVLFGLIACNDDVAIEATVSKVVENDEACPSEASVADERGEYDDAELTTSRTFERPTLCYYRLDAREEERDRLCTYLRSSLGALRRALKSDPRLAPSDSATTRNDGVAVYACEAERQLVAMIPTKEENCPDAMTPEARALAGASWKPGYELGELLAADGRPPYRYCEYHLSGERPRASGCGGNGTMFTGM